MLTRRNKLSDAARKNRYKLAYKIFVEKMLTSGLGIPRSLPQVINSGDHFRYVFLTSGAESYDQDTAWSIRHLKAVFRHTVEARASETREDEGEKNRPDMMVLGPRH